MEKIKTILKENYVYFLIHFGLMLIVLLIALTLPVDKDYALQIPGNNLFANVTWLIVIITSIIYYFLIKYFNKKEIKLEKLFLCLIIPLGIMYGLVNPLGKIPDETQHARKSMAISNGIFFAHKDEDGNPYDKFNSKINELVTTSVDTYEDAWTRITAAETDEEIMLIYSMATYAPICHMPQAFGMILARIFGGGVTVQCYMARLVNLLFSTFLFYEAIRFIPFKKIVVFFLGLLPLTISECASMSSDALTISGCIFYISYILYLVYDKSKEKINKKDIIILIISSIVVSLCKIVYMPLCLLLFTIPKDKFDSKKLKNIIVILIVSISIILNLIWLGYAATFLNEVNPGVNASEQVKFILSHPISYALILFRTIHIYNQTFIMSLCGEGLGNYNAQASVLFTIPCVIIFAFIFFINEEKDKVEFSACTKFIYAVIFSLIIILIYTSLYVAWTPLKNPLILGVQSRYFLPVLLLTAIVFDNKIFNINKKIENKYLISFMLFMNLNALSCLMFTYINNYIIEFYIK